ncbi:MAG: hypothetical protein IJH04_10040, partial [Eggerthellaceae bacterium]|nr:hypothetical protein [Eggerthellaceae bacterium]
MRKVVTRCLTVLSIATVAVALAACASSSGPSGSSASSGQAGDQKGFTSSLDTATEGSISVVGSYDNFEALEAEFEKFNAYYPKVELSYTKIDDYNNLVATALGSDNAPDIYFMQDFMLENDNYAALLEHAEDLSDPALNVDLSCVRPSLLSK